MLSLRVIARKRFFLFVLHSLSTSILVSVLFYTWIAPIGFASRTECLLIRYWHCVDLVSLWRIVFGYTYLNWLYRDYIKLLSWQIKVCIWVHIFFFFNLKQIIVIYVGFSHRKALEILNWKSLWIYNNHDYPIW